MTEQINRETAAPIQDTPNDFISCASEYLLTGNVEGLIARYHGNAEQVEAWVAQHSVDIEAKTAELVAEGRDIQLSAQTTLSATLRQLAAQVDGGALTAPTLIRIAEVLHKISGMEAKAKERTEPNRPSFQIRIILPGQKREINIGGGAAIDGVAREVCDE